MEASTLHVLHAIMASYFERRDGIKSVDISKTSKSILERRLKSQHTNPWRIHSIEIFQWVIDGLTNEGNLRLVHPQHGSEIIEDGEDLTWPFTMERLSF